MLVTKAGMPKDYRRMAKIASQIGRMRLRWKSEGQRVTWDTSDISFSLSRYSVRENVWSVRVPRLHLSVLKRTHYVDILFGKRARSST